MGQKISKSTRDMYEYENKRLRVAIKHIFAAHKIIRRFGTFWDFKNPFERIKILFVKLLFKQKYQLLLHVLEDEIQWEINRNQKIWIDGRIEK